MNKLKALWWVLHGRPVIYHCVLYRVDVVLPLSGLLIQSNIFVGEDPDAFLSIDGRPVNIYTGEWVDIAKEEQETQDD